MSKKKRKKAKAISNKKPAVDASLFELPNPFQKLSEDERAKLVVEMGAHYKNEFTQSLQRLKQLVSTVSPFDTLSHLSLYDHTWGELTKLVGERSEWRVSQPDIEILQALFLTIPSQEITVSPATPPVLHELRQNLRRVGKAFSLQRFGEKPSDPSVLLAYGFKNRSREDCKRDVNAAFAWARKETGSDKVLLLGLSAAEKYSAYHFLTMAFDAKESSEPPA